MKGNNYHTSMDKKKALVASGVIVAVMGLVALAGYGARQVFGYHDGRNASAKKHASQYQQGKNTESGSGHMRSKKGSEMDFERRGAGRGMGLNRQNCVGEQCLSVEGLDFPAGSLSDTAKQSLMTALDDEYRALATYQATTEKLGMVRPFSMISRAEEQHISMLKSLFDKYGVVIPENKYLSTVTAPATIQAACQVGVDAEIANAALYRDTLLPTVTAYPDMTQVFTNLMTASEERHLPAFDRCN